MTDQLPVNAQAPPANQTPADVEDDSDDAQEDTPEGGAAGGMCSQNQSLLSFTPRFGSYPADVNSANCPLN